MLLAEGQARRRRQLGHALRPLGHSNAQAPVAMLHCVWRVPGVRGVPVMLPVNAVALSAAPHARAGAAPAVSPLRNSAIDTFAYAFISERQALSAVRAR